MTLPDDWINEEEFGYSESRYEPNKYNTECKKCGTDLQTAGDRSGAIKRCPNCEVTVWMY